MDDEAISNQQSAESSGPLVIGSAVALNNSSVSLPEIPAGAYSQDSTPLVESAQLILYDATKPQRIPFMIEHAGEQFEIAFVLDGQTDNALIQYDRLCDRRFSAANQKETGERNAVETFDKSFEAAIWLFDDRALNAEGFEAPGEQLPENWKESIADDDKAAVIDDAYLAAVIAPLPIAKPGKRLPLSYRQEVPVSTINLRALFEGNELLLGHVMKTASADQVATYKSIQKERLLVQGTRMKGETRIPPKARKLGALYDQLNESVSGYANNYVPLHHKMLVVMEHLASEVEAVRKN